MNRSESDSIGELLHKQGYDLVNSDSSADLTIINSCSVTRQAAAKTRAEVTAARKSSPDGKVAVVGCYAQELGDELLNQDGVDLVLGNINKYSISEYFEELEIGKKLSQVKNINQMDWSKDGCSTFLNDSTIPDSSRTRANLKIQEGCDYYCSYCIIPYLRGSSRSRKFDSCIQEAQGLEETGYKEIVLTGINIGTYQDKGRNLVDLIQSLLAKTNLDRIRISSIEPDLVSDELIQLMKNEKRLCRHLHIPLQHGSDKILKKMNRRYIVEEYRNLVDKIADSIPEICLGTDIMTGFPGEGDREFEEMYKNLKAMPVVHYHVFRYSPREGTRAYDFPDQVHSRTAKQRAKLLRKLGASKKESFVAEYEGQNVEVLAEQFNKNNILTGYTENFIRVKFKGKQEDVNRIKTIAIKERNGEQLAGEKTGE